MWTREDVRRSYGLDIVDIEKRHPESLCGIVTPSGVIWRSGRPSPWPGREDGRMDMLRASGRSQCLFLHLDAEGEDELKRTLTASVHPDVVLRRLETSAGRCFVLFSPSEAPTAAVAAPDEERPHPAAAGT